MLLVFAIVAAALGGVEPFYAPPSSSPIGRRETGIAVYDKPRTIKSVTDTIYGIPERHLLSPINRENDTEPEGNIEEGNLGNDALPLDDEDEDEGGTAPPPTNPDPVIIPVAGADGNEILITYGDDGNDYVLTDGDGNELPASTPVYDQITEDPIVNIPDYLAMYTNIMTSNLLDMDSLNFTL